MVSSENSLDRLSSFKEDFYKDVTGVIKSRLFSIWIEFLSLILELVLFCIFSSNIPSLIFQEAISIFDIRHHWIDKHWWP